MSLSTIINASDRINVWRPRINSLINEFVNFTFDGSGNLTFSKNLDVTGTISTSEDTIALNDGVNLLKYDSTWQVSNNSGGTWNDIALTASLVDYIKKDGTVAFTGNARLGSNFLSNDGDSEGLQLDTSGNALITGNLELRQTTNARGLTLYNTYTGGTNYERGIVKWDSNILKIGVEKGSGGGTLRELGFVQTGLIKLFTYQGNVDDDLTFSLPLITNSGWGMISAGNNEEYSMFFISGLGHVYLISNSTNVVANSDIDGNICIGVDDPYAEPLAVKNRLGSTKNFNCVIFYD